TRCAESPPPPPPPPPAPPPHPGGGGRPASAAPPRSRFSANPPSLALSHPPPPPPPPPPAAPGGAPRGGPPASRARPPPPPPTAAQLDLRLAHARARDAVHAQLDEARLVAELAPLALPVLAVASAAADRTHYLMRPDLGRRLAGDAEARLAAHAGRGHDVAIVIADGLSARAVEAHARPLLSEALPRLAGWRIAPPVVVRPGPVAIGDAVARAVRADIAVVLIGERPGLSAPDSMGAYLTFKPTPQTTDAD